MAKLGVITDGISRDLEQALAAMREVGLRHAELQFVWDEEVGDLGDQDIQRAKNLVDQYEMTVCCISRHNFAGILVGETEVGDANHTQHMDGLRRCMDMAKYFDTSLVRIMSFRKEMILFGKTGADHWNVSKGAWEKLLELLRPPVELAETQDITLVVETGNNAMITSGQLGRKLIDELATRHLKVLWDPANSLYCNEPPYPDGYGALKGRYLGHIHMKDAIVDIPNATLEQCALGTGQMAPYLLDIAAALKADSYEGVVCLESVYRPPNGTFLDGFNASIRNFKEIFG